MSAVVSLEEALKQFQVCLSHYFDCFVFGVMFSKLVLCLRSQVVDAVAGMLTASHQCYD